MADKGAIIKHLDANGVRQETGAASPLPVSMVGGGAGFTAGERVLTTIIPTGDTGSNIHEYTVKPGDYALIFNGSGTWSGSYMFDVTQDGTRWYSQPIYTNSYGSFSVSSLGQSTTAVVVVSGFKKIRFRGSSVSSFAGTTELLRHELPPVLPVTVMNTNSNLNVQVQNAVNTHGGSTASAVSSLLGANASWTTGHLSRSNYRQIRVATFSDVAGEIVVHERLAGINDREVLRQATTAGVMSRVMLDLIGGVYKVTYINGPTAQTTNDIYVLALT